MPNYQYITEFDSPNYTEGRGGFSPEMIVFHHWNAPHRGDTFETTIATLCNPARRASAHYVVEAGRVACLVNCENTAWHAGDYGVNQRSIGIECHPECRPSDMATVAELIKELRDVYGNLPLVPHSNIVPTECPGVWRLRLNDLDAMARGTLTVPAPPAPDRSGLPAPEPTPPASSGVRIVEEGDTLWGFAEEWGPTDPQAMLDAIISANPGINPDLIYPGQEINLPW